MQINQIFCFVLRYPLCGVFANIKKHNLFRLAKVRLSSWWSLYNLITPLTVFQGSKQKNSLTVRQDDNSKSSDGLLKRLLFYVLGSSLAQRVGSESV